MKTYNPQKIIERAQELGIELLLIEGRLKVAGSKKSVTSKMLEVIKAHKQQLIEYLERLEEELEPLPCCICGLDANSVEEIFFYAPDGLLYCPLHWQELPETALGSGIVESTLSYVASSSVLLSAPTEEIQGPIWIDGIRVLPSWYSYTIEDRAREKVQELEEEDRARLSAINKSKFTQAS